MVAHDNRMRERGGWFPQKKKTFPLRARVGFGSKSPQQSWELSARFAGTSVAGRDSYEGDRTGGRPDFQGLVDLHYASLYRFALSLTRSESDASDLVQETFLTWAVKGHQLLEAARVKAWLFTTLHRGFLQRQRHTTRFPHLEITEAEVDLPSCDPDLASRLDSRTAVEFLGRVDAAFQAPVALFYLEDYSYREISEILEIPLGTVKSRIARGLAQLKELVRETAPGRARKEAK
jgi:RNA polymerase sigma-70 factor (ECF subfamily)